MTGGRTGRASITGAGTSRSTSSARSSTRRSAPRRETTGAAIGPARISTRNSVVAVDVNTGKYLWHFQSVHHDLWDSDQPSPPTLIDITRERTNDSRARADQQDGLDVHSRSHERHARVRRRGASGSEGRRARRVVFADAAVSREAAGARPHRLQEGRYRDRRRHDARAREGLPGLYEKSRRLLQRRSVYAVPLSRRRRAAEEHHPVSGQRRHELGRSGRRSDARLHFRVHAGRCAHGLDREEAAGRELRQRERLAAAVRPRQHHGPGRIRDLPPMGCRVRSHHGDV